MKKALKNILLMLVSAACICTVGCAKSGKDREKKADCIINGKKIYFVEDEVKKEWEKPLSELLSNVLVPYGEGGDIMGYKAAVDEKKPSVPQSYRVGLLDVTGDGVPELILHEYGNFGSSGAETYNVYNIHTGYLYGYLDGGTSSYRAYYNAEDDSFNFYGEYSLRSGWAWRGAYLSKIVYYWDTRDCRLDNVLLAEYDISMSVTEGEDIDVPEMEELYSDTHFYKYGKEISLDEYYREYYDFRENNIAVLETTLTLIEWKDICDDDDSYEERAKKMASALISLEQEYIDLNATNAEKEK